MFSLIDVLASREEAVSLKEISEKTGLHPSTTHRILNDLAVGRFVDRPEAGSYRLGMRLLELGNLVKGRLNVRDAALPPMRELHKLIQQPVNLRCARATRSSTSSAPTANARACRWCAPSAAARRCT
jgi:DNA-binding IclR family transcriptional regulator